MDGICLKRNWGGEYGNVSILVTIGVTEDGYHEVLGSQEAWEDAHEKTQAVVQKLRETHLKEATKKMADGIEKALTYYAFSSEH